MKLDKQVAIITGGAGSIGRATALRLAREGAIVVVCDINQNKVDEVVDELKASGSEALGLVVNLLKTQEIDQLAKTVIDRYGRIDILVTTAGGSARSKNALLQYAEEEVIDNILGVNLRSVMFVSRAVVGHMIEQKRGKIVNIASIVGINGKAKLADYSAAKAGVIAMTKSLALEVGPHGINVNCVSPGLVPRQDESGNLEYVRKTNVLGRICKPEDIANMVNFLVSDEADFITGQNFIVDGGRSLGLRGD